MIVIDPARMYSIAEATEITGCSRETIRLKIKNKKLVAARIEKGPYRIAGASLESLVAPIVAIQPATLPTRREVNRRLHNLLKPGKVKRTL